MNQSSIDILEERKKLAFLTEVFGLLTLITLGFDKQTGVLVL